MKKTSIFIAVLCLITLVLLLVFSNKKPTSAFYAEDCVAKSMVVIERESKRQLYEKNSNEQCAMASTTKIMTALVVIKNCKNIDEKIKISDKAVGITGTSIYLKHGEILTVRELLYGLILASGNDASVALAIHVGKSIENFVKLMNSEAKNCGAMNTNFENPHGLDAKNHYTTAFDLALITNEALKYDVFKEIVTTKNIKITGSAEGSYRFLRNKNKLIFSDDTCTGVKTGFTDNAGRCLVSSFKRNGMEIIAVVFNCGPMFEQCKELADKVYDNFFKLQLLAPYCFYKKIPVANGKCELVKTYTKEGFSYVLNKDETSKIEYVYDINENLEAPLKKEQEIGKLEIYLDNRLLFSTKIFTMEEVKGIGFIESLKEVCKSWTKVINEN